MRDKKILNRFRPLNGTSPEDLFDAVDKEYARRNPQPSKLVFSKSRHTYNREYKTHRQHFKWSHFINQSRKP